MREEFLGSIWISLMKFFVDEWHVGGELQGKQALRGIHEFFSRRDLPPTLLPAHHKEVATTCFRLFRLLYQQGAYVEALTTYRWCLQVFPIYALQMRHLKRVGKIRAMMAFQKIVDYLVR